MTAPRPAKPTVEFIDRYCDRYQDLKGVREIEVPGKGGRRHSYLSQEEEQAFLHELEPQAISLYPIS